MKNNILKEKNGHVYFYINNSPFTPKGFNIVKVGESSRGSTAIDRVNEVNSYQPFDGYLFHSIFCYDSKKTESLLKDFFVDKRTRGEWFLLNENDLHLIKNEDFPLQIINSIKGVSNLTHQVYSYETNSRERNRLYSVPKSFILKSKNLSLIERRLMHLLFFRTNPQERRKLLFTKNEYMKITKLKGNMHKILKRSLESIKEKSFSSYNKEEVTEYVDFLEYSNGSWKMRLSSELFKMQKNVNPFLNIKEIMVLPSLHSLRLYELLKYNNCNTPEFEISINLLRSILIDTGIDSGYILYSNFKNRVLKPSLEKINETLNQKYKMEEIKKGRAVYAICFIREY